MEPQGMPGRGDDTGEHDEVVDPGTVAALTAEVARLKAEVERLRDELRQARRAQHETPPHYL